MCGVRLVGGLTMQMPSLWLRRTVSSALSVRHTARGAHRGGVGLGLRVSEMEKGQQEKRKFWLLKTEPDVWSWQHQEENKGLSVWDGVRNAQAQNMMKSMTIDDLCFFYHTGKLKEVAGIVRVVKTFYPDPTDDTGKWGAVDVEEVKALNQPVTLAVMKGDEHFKGFLMLRQPRLSVVPVDESIWARVCELGGVEKGGSLPVKEAAKKGGGSLKNKKGAVKVDVQKTENGIPAKGAKASTREGKRSATHEVQTVENSDNGNPQKKQAKTGARKRGAKEVVDEPKKNTKPLDKNGSETEEAPSGSRTMKTRKKKKEVS